MASKFCKVKYPDSKEMIEVETLYWGQKLFHDIDEVTGRITQIYSYTVVFIRELKTGIVHGIDPEWLQFEPEP